MIKPTLVQIWKTRNDLETSVASKIIDVMHRSLKKNTRCCIVLSGGETPKIVYRHMGQNKPNGSVDWSRVHVFFCDERAVPPDHPNSNYGMIEREWISHISIPPENVHRIKGEIDPTIASEKYEQEIRNVFGSAPVVFDFVLLGVGEDGHTASLFPGSDAVLEKKALVRSAFTQRFNNWRVTLTVPALNASHEIVFLAAGKKKASIVRRILDAKVPDTKLPASLIRPIEGSFCWMIDEEAALQLKEDSSIIIERVATSVNK
ncbi:MAG: 6-phosphogluconolactonase [Ignavibacteriales bacterium]|nr:6-phosphogluconolactonase [Ignavibacteriales bacterium]